MRFSIKAWRRKRILARADFPQCRWGPIAASLPCLSGLTDAEMDRLRELVILFLHEKVIHAAAGLDLTEEMRLSIAFQACLPILNLGLDYYAGWTEVIVYPDQFLPTHEFRDDAGVVHVVRHPMAGESWRRGPVVLSWADAAGSADLDGVNVVIHEFAHKLDMLNGDANGYPPLHRGMRRADWARVFALAYNDFVRRVERGEDTVIDPYAAESPGEFFAVLSEAFFEIPKALKQCYPEVYGQLSAFYRQDPALRLPH
jgi:Mlc titration factor MtfA (ptsG expression regulator)